MPKHFAWLLVAAPLAATPLAAAAAELPIFDAHMHYSHDAWDVLPPKDVIAILKKAGVRRALVSSSGDDGQQRLKAEAYEIPADTPEQFAAVIRAEVAKWAPIVRESGLRPN